MDQSWIVPAFQKPDHANAHLNCLGCCDITFSAPEKSSRPLREAALPEPGSPTAEAAVADKGGA
ncbi:hypothetical protein [Nonomuraea jabiensis]|uniref:hypothetical protein n=1 Tax=Nonomuraea jabiensis TaxID=882448 RepID=UPI003D723D68